MSAESLPRVHSTGLVVDGKRHMANANTALVKATEARIAAEREEKRALKRLRRLKRKYEPERSTTDGGQRQSPPEKTL